MNELDYLDQHRHAFLQPSTIPRRNYPLSAIRDYPTWSTSSLMAALPIAAMKLLRSMNLVNLLESKNDNGQAAAINKGMNHATGEIRAWLNSDDYYLPGTLQLVGKSFQNDSIEWISGLVIYGDQDGLEEDRNSSTFKNQCSHISK